MTEYRGSHRSDDPPYDPDATVVLPRIYGDPDATVMLPRLRVNDAEATMMLPVVPAVMDTASAAVQVPAPPVPGEESTSAIIVKQGSIMALGSLVSRATGFLRTTLLGAALGGGLVANAYSVANTIPAMVYELLLGGVLASVLVPQLVRARQRDPDRGEAYTQRLLSLLTLVLGVATVFAVLAAPLLTAMLASDNSTSASRRLMTVLGFLLLPEIFFMGLAGMLGAILNSRSRFGPPMWVPILNNLVVIVAALLLLVLPGPGQLTPDNISTTAIVVLGLGTTLGIAVQAIALVPAVRSAGFTWRWRFDFRELHLRELARLAAWMLCYIVVSQIGVLVVVKLANAAGDANAAGPWIYNNAFLLFMMAHGIVGVSIITALLPRMSAAAARGEYRSVASNISLGTRLTSVVLVPTTMLYILLGTPLAVVLFEWGRYDHTDAVQTGKVVTFAGLTLLPYAVSQIQLFAFYALADTKTPALINISVVAVKIIVDLTLYYNVPAEHVAAALMYGNAVSYTVSALVSGWLLRHKIGKIGLASLIRTLARLLIAAGVAGLLAWGAARLVAAGLGDAKGGSFVQLMVGGIVLAGVYVAAGMAMRVREITEVGALVRRKLGR